MIKILLADDHPLILNGLRTLLAGFKDLHIVGEAIDGEEVVRQCRKLKPDVVVMDISMPRKSGLEAAHELKTASPGSRVLFLTMHESEEYAGQVLEQGAGGYILKSAEKTELVTAIRKVASGERYFGRAVQAIVERAGSRREKAGAIPITRREREIIRLIVQGLTNQEIAEKLFISPRTVDTHRSNLMQKLELRNAAALVKYAIEHGLDQ